MIQLQQLPLLATMPLAADERALIPIALEYFGSAWKVRTSAVKPVTLEKKEALAR